jgi:hypothetical protein
MVRVIRGALSRRDEVRVRLTEKVEATIYDRPGEWMSDAELERLRAELRGVASAAIPGPLEYGVFLPRREPYANRLVVVGRHLENDEAVGFNAMPRLDVKLANKSVTVLHLGLLVIHPRYQRQGFQGLLYGLGGFSSVYRMRERPIWISNVSEVPAVIGAVTDNFLDVFPHYAKPGQPPPAEHAAIAKAIMSQHRHEFGVGPDAGFDEQRFVITGGYTGGSDALKKTFEQAPRYRADACNQFCKQQLDYARGDDFLQIGQLDAGVITAYLGKRLPAELRPAAARQMKLWQYPSQGARS